MATPFSLPDDLVRKALQESALKGLFGPSFRIRPGRFIVPFSQNTQSDPYIDEVLSRVSPVQWKIEYLLEPIKEGQNDQNL